jgi:uncharacterized membrane protein
MRAPDKRITVPGIAALLAGGYFLARALERRRHPHPLDVLTEPVLEHDVHVRVPMAAAVGAVAALAVGGMLFTQRSRLGSGADNTVVEWIELDVPVSTAYNQWTQFEEFPKFMATVQSVHQVDDTHLHWRALVGGKIKEWDAEITEQIPDQRIAWRSTGGVYNAGVVTFHKISDTRTRVLLQMDYSPESMVEKAGDAAGAVKLTTKANLKKFKSLVESRGTETGAWRGTVTH